MGGRGARDNPGQANRRTIVMPANGAQALRGRPLPQADVQAGRKAMGGLSPPSTGAGSTPGASRRQVAMQLPSPVQGSLPPPPQSKAPEKPDFPPPTLEVQAPPPEVAKAKAMDPRRLSAQMHSRATKSYNDLSLQRKASMADSSSGGLSVSPRGSKSKRKGSTQLSTSVKKFAAFKRNKSIDPNKFVPVDQEEKKKRKDRSSESAIPPQKPPAVEPRPRTPSNPQRPQISPMVTGRERVKARAPSKYPTASDVISKRPSVGNVPRGVEAHSLSARSTPALNVPARLRGMPGRGGPSRAPARANSNYRLSQRLTLQAVAVNSMLEDRQSLQELRSRGILREAPTEEAKQAVPTWTSKVAIADEWVDPEPVAKGQVPLIARACIDNGFHIENGRRLIGDASTKDLEGDRDILDAHLGVRFFAQLKESADKIVHFAGEHETHGPVIASVEKNKEKKFARALVRYSKGSERFLVSTSGSTKSQMKNLANQMPFLSDYKLQEVRGDDVDVFTENLLQYEDKEIVSSYKIGVIYAKDGQTTDDEYFNNAETPLLMEEFLTFLGDKVKLEGFQGYRGGLDVKTGTTGTHSIYRKFRGFEIMFHVSTMIPYFPMDHQQVERKRHLGNDVVVIVFKEGNTPFDPDTIHSQFNHIFIVVEPYKIINGSCTHYRVEICSKPGVRSFRPYLVAPGIYPKNMDFLELLLLKIVNGERAAMYAPDFRLRMSRTRKMLLKEVMKGTKLRTSKRQA